MDFYTLLKNNEFVMLDGAMGTMLQADGMELGGLPELLCITDPQRITAVHRKYIEAGAQIVYTNTFGANRHKLASSGRSVSEVITAAVQCAKKACEGTDALVALDIGPIGQLLEPSGSLTFEEAWDIFAEMVRAGEEAGADIAVCETMTDLSEVRAAVLAVKENSSLPVMATMSFEQNMRTFTGCSVQSMALTLQGIGADAIGMNCSLGPRELYGIVDELAKYVSVPIVIKPNAGLPDPETNTYDVTPSEYGEHIRKFALKGVKLIGGCCGTTPEYISEAKKAIESLKYNKNETVKGSFICTASRVVPIDGPRIIGERINPTGKKLFKEALKRGDIDYILSQAVEQASAGAEILDVNVGLPDIDEKDMMVRTVKALCGVTDLPLQIDSTIPEVIEAALRIYPGKAIVNSVNGEDEVMDRILPLVKRYGAAVVGLTLDNGGIPKTADGRFDIAKKILDRALSMGIPREDVFIDCLTLTASAEQAGAAQTLSAVKRVKDELGLHTVLGVSNISFGLPNRETVNCCFLTMALNNGLDLPIINPNIPSMTGAVRAYRLLKGIDTNSIEFIEAYGAAGNAPKTDTVTAGTPDVFHAVIKGLKSECAKATKLLLDGGTDPMDIVNTMLIPALDSTGSEFEKGRIFLPQLILSAEASQAAFEEIKKHMLSSGSKTVSKGDIILATVKGDIHDIGKNIVKVLLENYGYNVIDLGKDVDCMKVVNTAIEKNVKLVGLSALMTTTLCSMEKTISLLREHNVDCKVMVGGAVLTPEYAERIGADYYARDAKESVDIAKRVLG